jgi:hypothetical protein
MIRITLDLIEGIDPKAVADSAVIAWLKACQVPGESEAAMAKRLKVSYRILRYWRDKQIPPTATLAGISDETDIPQPCEFCGKPDGTHQHHVVNRHDSPVTVTLCSTCHRKFHFLNRLYAAPTKKASKTAIVE